MEMSSYMGQANWKTNSMRRERLRNVEIIFISILISLAFLRSILDMFNIKYNVSSFFKGGIGEGLIRTWNDIADTIGARSYVILPKFLSTDGGSEAFITVLGVVLIFVAYLILKNGKKAFLLVFVLPQLIMVPAFNLSISNFEIGFLTIAILSGLLFSIYPKTGFFLNFSVIVVIVCIALVALGTDIVSPFVSGIGNVKDIRETTSSAVARMYYGENALKNGDLTKQRRGKISGTALKVTMDTPHSTYLRGFVGEVYSGTNWKPMEDSFYYSNNNLMYWLQKEGLNKIGQLGQANDLVSPDDKKGKEQNKIVIDNVKADARYAYVPYGVDDTKEVGRDYGGSFIKAPKFSKMTKYTYRESENPAKKWTTIAAELFTSLNHDNNEKSSEYLKLESHYNKYVYSNYRYISPSVRKTLLEAIGSPGDQSKGHVDYKKAILGIRKYLDENFIYTEHFGDENKPINGDMLSNFIKNKRGYDVQFATAATLMFRYYGIPARYVEGYLITPEDAKRMKSVEKYKIPMDRIHAWTEIYVDGIGFVPIEVSPKYFGLMEEADLEIGLSNDSLSRAFEEEKGSSGNEMNRYGGDEKQHPKFRLLILILIIVGILLIILVLFFLIKQLLSVLRNNRKYTRLFKLSDYKIAVSAMYAYTEYKGYEITEEIRMLGNRAAYGNEKITEEDKDKMLAMIKSAKDNKKRF